jgi:hypothetical protein
MTPLPLRPVPETFWCGTCRDCGAEDWREREPQTQTTCADPTCGGVVKWQRRRREDE